MRLTTPKNRVIGKGGNACAARNGGADMTETEDGTPGSGEPPQFLLRLPGASGVDRARGVLLDEVGTNGSRKFRILAGSPARDREMPSFSKHFSGTAGARETMRNTGVLRPSTRWPGWLELAQDVDCGSPSFAAGVLVGAPRNGWVDWKTEAGAPLSDFMEGVWSGPARAWLVRGSNVVRGRPRPEAVAPRGAGLARRPSPAPGDRPGNQQGATCARSSRRTRAPRPRTTRSWSSSRNCTRSCPG